VAYVGNTPSRGQWRKLTDISASFNGVTTTFTTSVPPGTSQYYVTAGTASQLIISLGGVIQEPDVDYSVSTNSITFTTAPAAGLSFFGVLCGDALNTGVPSDGSITTAKLGGNLTVDLASGSASTPSLTFDSNTGLYSPGEDQVAVATNGVKRIEIQSDGDIDIDGGGVFYDATNNRLAIGTATPNNKVTCQDGNILVRSEVTTGSPNSYHIGFSATSAGGIAATISSARENANEASSLTFNNWNGSSFGERARIDSSGRLLVGTSSTGSVQNQTIELHAVGQGVGQPSYHVFAYTGGTSSDRGYFQFAKSRGSSVGSKTVVASGDSLGSIRFNGADGTGFIAAAEINGEVDGTPGTNDMPGRLVFSTTADGANSPTERMRISQNGQVRVSNALEPLLLLSTSSAGTTNYILAGNNSATTSVYIWSNGNIQNTNGSYTAISDAKLKENIVDASSQWSDFKAIKIRNWNFKAETGHETHRQIGPIAQELEAVCPGLVFETPDRDEDGNETGEVTKGVNQSVLYMKAVKALQEAMERIEQLETKVAALEAQ